MEAEIKVLTVVNLNKTNEVETRSHLTDGIESALKKRFEVIAITVLGKSYNNQMDNFLDSIVDFLL